MFPWMWLPIPSAFEQGRTCQRHWAARHAAAKPFIHRMPCAKQIGDHSHRTFFRLRKRNLRNPGASLIHPFGSTESHFRSAQAARPSADARRAPIRCVAGRFASGIPVLPASYRGNARALNKARQLLPSRLPPLPIRLHRLGEIGRSHGLSLQDQILVEERFPTEIEAVQQHLLGCPAACRIAASVLG